MVRLGADRGWATILRCCRLAVCLHARLASDALNPLFRDIVLSVTVIATLTRLQSGLAQGMTESL